MNKLMYGFVATLAIGTVLTGCETMTSEPRSATKDTTTGRTFKSSPAVRVATAPATRDTTAEQISNRVARLVSGTAKRLQKEGPSVARKFVYEFGIVQNARIDIPVARVKWGLLNSWVNPKEWKLRHAELNAKQNDYTKRGDLDGLIAFLRQERKPAVASYSDGIDKSIDGIQSEVKRLEAIEVDASSLEAKKRAQVQMLLDDFRGAYEAETRKDPNFVQLESLFSVLNGQLQAQDISVSEADAFCKTYELEVQTLVKRAENVRRSQIPNMTTRQLNENIHKWYDSALKDALKAKELAEKIAAEAKAKAEREAKDKAESEAAEKASEKAKAEALAAAEKAKKEFIARLYAMRQATEKFDLDKYIAHAEEAIPQTAKANRAILGDYARTLRLVKRGKLPISKEEAAAVLTGAALLGQPEMIGYAKTLGASPDDASRYDDFKRPAIVLATKRGDLATVKALIAAVADVNKTDANKETALVLASRNGCVEIAKALISAKADVNAKGHGGDTALIAAARAGNTELIGILSSAGAQFVSKNDKKLTAWMAALEANRLNAVKVLLVGCPAQASDASKALELAVQTDDSVTVEYTVATWKIRDVSLLTVALPAAARNGCLSVVKTLVANGAEITDVAMVAAVQSCNLATVKYIVRMGGNVLTARNEKMTPAILEYLKGQGL